MEQNTKENFRYISAEDIHATLKLVLSREAHRMGSAMDIRELRNSTQRWIGAMEFVEDLDPAFDVSFYDDQHRAAFSRNYSRLE